MANKSTKTQLQMERDWQAEDDARTMAQYQEILQDKSRMDRAIKAAKTKANDLNKRADAMNRVANTKSPKSTTTKSASKSKKK